MQNSRVKTRSQKMSGSRKNRFFCNSIARVRGRQQLIDSDELTAFRCQVVEQVIEASVE
jgi:hypothetical protein